MTIDELAAKVARLEKENSDLKANSDAMAARLSSVPGNIQAPPPNPWVVPGASGARCSRCGDTSHRVKDCPMCEAGHGQRGCVFAAPVETTCAACGARGGPDPRKLGPMEFQPPPQRQHAVARDTGGSCLPLCGPEGHHPQCARINPTDPKAKINWQLAPRR